MANTPAGTEVDAKEIERTVNMWRNFTTLIKYGTIATLVLLVLMAWFLL